MPDGIAVPLTGERGAGRFALVDEGDYELVSRYRWRLDSPNGKDYALTWVEPRPAPKSMRMHVLIMGRPGVDHRNGDGLDNRRSNLRPATQAQNLANRRKSAGCSSQFKGVSWNIRRSRWEAYCGTSGRGRRYLGAFTSEEDGARAYDAAAAEMFGEFARLNFPAEH